MHTVVERSRPADAVESKSYRRHERPSAVLERLASITDDLVAFPTIARNPAALRGCVEWVYKHVQAHVPAIHVRRFESGGKPSILFTIGNRPPRILLCGHLDVVEASDDHAFAARRVRGGQLVGRGTADMKGPVAALLDIVETDPTPGLGLLLTTDEENGGAHGTRHVLESIDWRPDVVVLPDGGANMRLVIEQKGVMRVQLVSKGEAAHAARPWQGKNAIGQLYRGYSALQRAYPVPIAEDDWRVSMALTELRNGDNAPNSVPEYAEGTLDIRFPAGGPDVRARLFPQLCSRLARYHVSADISLLASAFLLDAASPWVERLQEAARGVQGKRLPLCREAGASDARYFSAEGVPVLVFQPECAGWHGAHEWVGLRSLVTFRSICAEFVRAALCDPARDPHSAAVPTLVSR